MGGTGRDKFIMFTLPIWFLLIALSSFATSLRIFSSACLGRNFPPGRNEGIQDITANFFLFNKNNPRWIWSPISIPNCLPTEWCCYPLCESKANTLHIMMFFCGLSILCILISTVNFQTLVMFHKRQWSISNSLGHVSFSERCVLFTAGWGKKI